MSILYYDPRIRLPIPPVFRSDRTGRPIEQCLNCERPLLEEETPYLVEKAVLNGETIFEYALCFPCRARMAEEMSSETRVRIGGYIGKRMDLPGRRAHLPKDPLAGVDPWLERCVVTGRARADCPEYQIVALCRGPFLALGDAPFLIAGEALGDLGEMLSTKTRDTLGEWQDEHLGLPPEFRDEPVGTGPMMI